MRDLAGNLHLCSINTATLGFQTDIFKTADAIAKHGFGGIAPWLRDTDGHDISAVSKHIKNTGLALSGYCRSPYIPAKTVAEFNHNITANKRAIDDAVTLNAPSFIFVVGSLPTGTKDLSHSRQQVQDGIAELADYAKDMPIQLGLEPLHPMYANDRSCLNTLAQAHAMARAIEPNPNDPTCPKIAIALDVYHCWWDPDLDNQIATIGADNRLCAFHVCDWLVPTTDFLMDRGMMGDGVVDIPKIRHCVETAGYDSMVEVEIFSHTWGKRSVDDILTVCAERLQTEC